MCVCVDVCKLRYSLSTLATVVAEIGDYSRQCRQGFIKRVCDAMLQYAMVVIDGHVWRLSAIT